MHALDIVDIEEATYSVNLTQNKLEALTEVHEGFTFSEVDIQDVPYPSSMDTS
jgi:hypothetical protein